MTNRYLTYLLNTPKSCGSQETVSFTHKKSPPRPAATNAKRLTTSKSLNRLDESLVTGTKMSPIRYLTAWWDSLVRSQYWRFRSVRIGAGLPDPDPILEIYFEVSPR